MSSPYTNRKEEEEEFCLYQMIRPGEMKWLHTRWDRMIKETTVVLVQTHTV